MDSSSDRCIYLAASGDTSSYLCIYLAATLRLPFARRFKWDHLTEEIAYLRAIKEQRLAAEISAATKERDFYLGQVDRAKAIESIKERKRKRREREGGPSEAPEEEGPKRKMFFGQRIAKPDPVSDPAAPRMSRQVLSALAGK